MKKIITLFIEVFIFKSLTAQTISGAVIDSITNEPLHYVNVIMLRMPDLLYISGTTTDEKGNFSLQKPQQNNCLLKFSFIGYRTQTLNIKDIQDGTIRLKPEETALKGIVITAKKPLFKMENGGISTNIQNSRLKDLGNATNVLGQLPMIRENNGNFEVFGKGAPLIYVNNRLLRDMSELERINSSTIKKVTISTNPGPEYDASVKSVIRIETTKQIGDGLGGTLFASALKDKYFSPTGYANLNYCRKKMDVFAMVNISQRKRTQQIDWQQNIYNGNQPFTVIEDDDRYIHNRFFTTNTGINYSFNDNNSAGIKYEYTGTPRNKTIDKTSLSAINNIEDKTMQTFQKNTEKNSRHYTNAYYYGKLSPWLSVKLDMDVIKGNKDNDQFVTNNYQDSIEIISTESSQQYDLFASKLVFTSPIFKGEARYGGEYSFTNNLQDFVVLEQGGNQNLFSNNNKAKQNLYAGFVSYNRTFDKWEISAGIRTEIINFKYFVDNEIQDGQSKKYHQWFPNFDISYNHDKLQFMAGYSKSISRPSYFQLRNNIRFNNAYAYESGNPYLRPAIDHTLSASLKWKKFLLSTNYDIYEDVIMINSTPYTNEIVLSKFENFSNFKSLSFSAYYSTAIGKWKPSVDLGVTKNFFSFGNPEKKYSTPAYSITQRNSIVMFKDLQLGADVYYVSAGHLDFDYSYDVFRINGYLSKTFLDRKLTINFFARDIFGTDRYKTRRDVNNVSVNVMNNLNNRSLTLSVTYSFNSTKKKYQGSNATEEYKRL